MTTYLLCGGGTAGHVNPLLAIADRLRSTEPDSTIIVLGTAEGLEARLVPERGYELVTVPKLPFPRRPNRAALSFPGKLSGLVRSIGDVIASRGVDVVVGVGGYVSAPAYVAARRAGVPIALHEANARPGMANRLGAMLTKQVGVAFEGTPLRHSRVVGMPLRDEIEKLDRRSARAQAVDFFGLDPHRHTLLVTGGSLGARVINETVAESAAIILGTGWQILHITGERDVDAVTEPLPHHHVVAYCDRMDLALAVADLAVSRAGAATVSELTGLGIPAVYVPLAIGNGEQRLNARHAVSRGAAILVDNSDFTPGWVRETLVPLMMDQAALVEMAGRAAGIGVLNGTDRMIELVHEAVRIN
ncbi:UDP-N-acetylglucosamine--N-acetylmuramyl-(pentapeptide) pyrophosphoryl-undecaprenol N-acetylglucosamine transferase [Salinibacterium hongtaonis]|uniref:UDP-N-acetylglucosamine--N-acetylmuramyl-(pentapeptide) pyrophosphoryl-undecaprenol N-acetylglucosamine transferase n=1 Tax=Homoserinimonas hongtaonis TaxID=2079791 RepID=A0A2U1SY83_9MICO|nr:UDP-N-acetylglucosamine--N-acetylmuramyl-(pentapeptide) pyrophosphoryl-undecaprenol N-acetylglucosamine transferase [Salinibacterium hongtaonis]AWB89117.1 UDP-N-acetylglucosamine--N-acetylmuramyl-(pentapeptide) pyrophosphoryl-undecaprenol N-acetylglucosamine transferase [Salinibacterium hongtaonis]PWB96566.1 UDP-N-acetylglucosamine--N-acetylmuramyl-(pentapeptide) pyrophosphoryl-undecaprenol N-acetylglucosamine transferase [Salinibacterium hongtaonis]